METRRQLLDYLNNRMEGKEQAQQLLEEIDQAVSDLDSTPFLDKGEVSVGRECAIEWELLSVDAPVAGATQDNDEEDEEEKDDWGQDDDSEQDEEDDTAKKQMSYTLGLRLWRPQDATEPQLSVTVWVSGPTTQADWREIKRLQALLGGALHRYRYGENWNEDLLELKRLPLASLDMDVLAKEIVDFARRVRGKE